MKINPKEIAVIIITCNRESFYTNLINSIDIERVGKIYTVNAGNRYSSYPKDVEVIFPKRNPTVVGVAKNIGLRKAKEDGYKYLFLLEDDIIIKDNNVWIEYIETAADSGLWTAQLSYAAHGGISGGNVNRDGTAKKRTTIEYSKKKVDIYLYSFQAFTLIHADHLTNNVFFREIYENAAEHLDQHQTIFLQEHKGLPLLWHPDIYNSFLYIEDQDADHKESVIRKDPNFMKNFNNGWGEFKRRFGYFPQDAPRFSDENIVSILNDIEDRLAQKELLS